jgi:hypothetical protein
MPIMLESMQVKGGSVGGGGELVSSPGGLLHRGKGCKFAKYNCIKIVINTNCANVDSFLSFQLRHMLLYKRR